MTTRSNPIHVTDCESADDVIIAYGDRGQPTVWCDPCIADLVRAVHAAGLRPIASCCGHGRQAGSIVLADGRELLITEFKVHD